MVVDQVALANNPEAGSLKVVPIRLCYEAVI